MQKISLVKKFIANAFIYKGKKIILSKVYS